MYTIQPYTNRIDLQFMKLTLDTTFRNKNIFWMQKIQLNIKVSLFLFSILYQYLRTRDGNE